ncbi:HNH endonuclease [Paenibacillus methanolicus]|uniref:HNH endonuclease n=1 Tax=Paenibacillus methanolicus TaxID=582686 RepID=A0A5S5BYT5_9BACL|nr:HNH endonuclease signature motif containing protein [Paenibacillus methanolicus]TYP71386.1 HNH endonuclease [Paenibacillus methanolicus]
MEAKRCGACGLEKPITSFTKRSGRSGRRGTCRSCQRKRGREADTGPTPGDEATRLSAGEDELGHAAEAANQKQDPPGPSAGADAARSGTGRNVAMPATSTRDERLDADHPTSFNADIDADMDGASTHIDAERPRKRKRRRRKKRAAAPVEPAQLVQLPSEAEARGQDEQSGDGESGLIPLLSESESSAGESDVAMALVEVAAPEADGEAPARKRKRRRRRKSKAKPVQTSALPSGEERAEAQWLLPDEEDDDAFAGDAEWQEAPADGDEGDGAPTRKRKRRRRRKRKSGADQAIAPARPQIRPPYKRILPIKGPFKFDVALLNDRGTGLIRLRGRRETGKRWSTEIPTEMAIRMVSEGAAGIINPSLIHKLYTKTDFRLLILQRDDYICKYCGRFGDTIDHVMPKSKGGLSTPDNCVCACAECNLKKADHLDFVFDDF